MTARLTIPALGDERGTTLVEVLVVGVLLSVVVAAAAVFLPSALQVTRADAERVDALDRAGVAMARMQGDVRAALELRAPAPDVLELRLLQPVLGAPATERWVRWDCSLPDGPGRRACERTEIATGAVSGGVDGLVGDAEPVFALRPVVADERPSVDLRLTVRTTAGRRPVVLRSSATQRACERAPDGGPCP